MAWEARSGLKQLLLHGLTQCSSPSLNGLGGPFGIETVAAWFRFFWLGWLNGLGGPSFLDTF